MKNKKSIVISYLLILFPCVAGLIMWEELNASIGEIGRNGKLFAIFGIPVLLLLFNTICIVMAMKDKMNVNQNTKVMNVVLMIIPMLSVVISGCNYFIIMGNGADMELVMRLIFGLMFFVLGNYMPKCKRNSTIGIKVSWTLHNDENWNKTHRFTGKVWVFGGILILISLFFEIEAVLYALCAVTFVMVVLPLIYSYMYYRKQLAAGDISKDDVRLSKSEKMTTAVALSVVVISIAVAALLLLVGKYEIRLNDKGIDIDATGWEDLFIPYDNIDSIEYRKAGVSGSRVMGYGTNTIVMGMCENDEFGEYTSYMYVAGKSAIVIRVDGEIVVINVKDEQENFELYEEIKRRSE